MRRSSRGPVIQSYSSDVHAKSSGVVSLASLRAQNSRKTKSLHFDQALRVLGSEHFPEEDYDVSVSETDTDEDKGGTLVKTLTSTVLPHLQPGFSLSISRSLFLDGMFGFLVLLNAVAIGVSSDVAVEWTGWIIIDGVFALIFFFEMLLKIFLQRWQYVIGSDRWWNLFEAGLVVLAFFEFTAGLVNRFDNSGSKGTTGLALLRILRLARITRLLRVCRLQIFTELKIMIKGALGGIRTLMWAAVLICLPLYAAAIMFRETLGTRAQEGGGAEAFATVPLAFFTLFRCTVSSECTDHAGRPIFALVANKYGWMYSVMFCGLELFMTMGLFNAIAAIFIENVLAGTRTNDLIMQRERLRDKHFFATKMTELVSVILEVSQELSGDEVSVPTTPKKLLREAALLEITPEVLDAVRQRPKVSDILHDLALADEDAARIFDIIDVDGNGSISVTELFECIAKLRGAPCRSDVVGLNFLLLQVQDGLAVQRDICECTWEAVMDLSGPGKVFRSEAAVNANAQAQSCQTSEGSPLSPEAPVELVV